jgi:hypothetical protein
VFGVPNHLMASDLAGILGDFSAEDLRTMARAHSALQLAGSTGRVVRRPDYLTNPEFQDLHAPHPVHTKPPPRKRRPSRPTRPKDQDKSG